jgi:hypothetical protein
MSELKLTVVIPQRGAFIVVHHHPHSGRRPELIPLREYIEQRTAAEAAANDLFDHNSDMEEIERADEQVPYWPLRRQMT